MCVVFTRFSHISGDWKLSDILVSECKGEEIYEKICFHEYMCSAGLGPACGDLWLWAFADSAGWTTDSLRRRREFSIRSVFCKWTGWKFCSSKTGGKLFCQWSPFWAGAGGLLWLQPVHWGVDSSFQNRCKGCFLSWRKPSYHWIRAGWKCPVFSHECFCRSQRAGGSSGGNLFLF